MHFPTLLHRVLIGPHNLMLCPISKINKQLELQAEEYGPHMQKYRKFKTNWCRFIFSKFLQYFNSLFFFPFYVYFNSFCIAFKISISTNIRKKKKKKHFTRKRGEAQTLLKLFRSYMKPVSFNHVTWNSL